MIKSKLDDTCIKCEKNILLKYMTYDDKPLCEKCSKLFVNCFECGKIILDSIKTNIICPICQVKYNQDNICKITNKLFLTNYTGSRNYNELKKLGVKQILSIGKELNKHETSDFKIMHIDIYDNPEEQIDEYFDETFKFIENDCTLVHCYAGVSRSATIVIAYLMRKFNLSYENAREICVDSRPFINPNYGFIVQLKNFEKKINIKDHLYQSDLVEEDDIIKLSDNVFQTALYKNNIKLFPLGREIFETLGKDI